MHTLLRSKSSSPMDGSLTSIAGGFKSTRLAICVTKRFAMGPTYLVLMALTLVTCLFFQLLLKWKNYRYQRCGDVLPPGSMGVPLLGEMLQYFTQSSSHELHPFFKRRLERYGPIFRTSLFGQNMIVSLDPELNNYVFQQEGKAFEMWFPDSFLKIMGEENIIRSSGSLHKHSRNLILRVIGHENLRLVHLHDVQRIVQNSLSSWLEKPSIELKKAVSSMAFNISANRLLGNVASKISMELWQQYDDITQGLQAFPLNIVGTAYYKSLQGRKNAMMILSQLLGERKNSERREIMDFLDLIISELKKENPMLTENYALNLLFVQLFFSSDTMSNALTAAVKFLYDNPKALQKLADEHQKIRTARTDPESKIRWEEYKTMKFTSHVVLETLRLANIAPVLFRKAKKDVHINGYTIPEGWIFMPCLEASHLRPTTYEDPTVFNPSRWENITKPGRGSKDFVAFGSGLRFCVGADLAKLQIAIFLHLLVTKYRLEVISGGDMVFTPGLGFPKGFQVKLLLKTQT